MNTDDLDRILSKEAEIRPSPRFVNSVMRAVRSEALTPPALPFPWKQTLPGIGASVVALAWAVVEAIFPSGRQAEPILSSLIGQAAAVIDTAQTLEAGWISLALLLTFCSARLATYLVNRRLA